MTTLLCRLAGLDSAHRDDVFLAALWEIAAQTEIKKITNGLGEPMHIYKKVLPAAVALALAACGGGSDTVPDQSEGATQIGTFPRFDPLASDLPLNTDLIFAAAATSCLLYTSPSPRDRQKSRMPSSA